MTDKVQISQAAFDRLKTEHDDLTTRGRIDIARKIETARELGDLSENGDYHAAKEEQGKMEGRIIHLARIIENAEITEEGEGDGTITSGSVVSLRYEGDDEPDDYYFGSIEERGTDLPIVSPGSPLGKAIAGLTAGETVTYDPSPRPDGDPSPPEKWLTVEVVAVKG